MRRVPILQSKNRSGWLLITLIVAIIIDPSGAVSVKKMLNGDYNRPLLYGLLLRYPVIKTEAGLIAMGSHPVSAVSLGSNFRARPSLCRGKRLDTLGPFSPDNYITADQCMKSGGDCCNFSPEWGFANNDPSYMRPLDRCHGCYDTRITVQCTGNVLRSRERHDEEESNVVDLNDVTASKCIQSGGRCCDQRMIPELFGNGPGVFDPHQFPREEHCSNCFSGSMYRLECTGKLLQSDSYTGDICSQFDGKCCQDIYGAFDPARYPNRDCSVCFSGSIQEE
ncbi:hypothetical protein DAPPUDRAFT_221144 [Daphnia pulex]|uniref:Uncharacterized protein n=1 Tax=Daphnia pulex TaxID=6669 RepID=E9FWN5_DAPPU|nr:hypothetical protein DAPPUDRAFT_221144 [Daphnia pulex]|eukprot:EFX87924.1 hypothetical protein DAPPUDRAFT_221144 [Daphnia pulex]